MDDADFSQRLRATVGGMISSGNAMCFAQHPKNSASSSCTCWPRPSWYTRERRYAFGARSAIAKSRGGSVEGLGGFDKSGEVSTSSNPGASGT